MFSEFSFLQRTCSGYRSAPFRLHLLILSAPLRVLQTHSAFTFSPSYLPLVYKSSMANCDITLSINNYDPIKVSPAARFHDGTYNIAKTIVELKLSSQRLFPSNQYTSVHTSIAIPLR